MRFATPGAKYRDARRATLAGQPPPCDVARPLESAQPYAGTASFARHPLHIVPASPHCEASAWRLAKLRIAWNRIRRRVSTFHGRCKLTHACARYHRAGTRAVPRVARMSERTLSMTDATGGVERFDAIVIGSGQGANPLAQALAKAGRHTALIESTYVGGTCINVGCSPTKTMVASARVAYLARRGADYGVHTGPIAIDMTKVRA